MDVLAIIGILAAFVGIIAGIVQVVQYVQERRSRLDQPRPEAQIPPIPPAPQIPHNLPPRSEFIGRETEKARVHEALRSRSYLVSIDGIGGIGKTVLALEVAHECLQASSGDGSTDGIATFDGFIWATAKDRDLTLNVLLDAVARTLDYPGIVQQPVEEKRDSVRKLLQESPCLLIVDNFETVTDRGVRDFLLQLPEPSRTLITTREQEVRQAWAVSLKGLEGPEALALIRNEGRRLGLAALERGEDHTLLHLHRATGGTPLAIKWAVGQIKQKGQSLDTVLAALHGARGSIFDNIFARSWGLLSEDARRVLVVMSIFATSASREGIEAVSEVNPSTLDGALGQLVEMSLVDATDELDLARRRYSVHPLTRAFAAARLRQEPAAEVAANRRLADFIQSFTREHGGAWNLEGFDQLESELPNILAIVQWCWDHQLIELAMYIFYFRVSHFLVIRGYWNDAMNLSEQGVAEATEIGDELTIARLRVWPIGSVLRHRGDLDLAERHTAWALGVFERLDEQDDAAYAKRNLGRILQARGEHARAQQLLREALHFFKSIRHTRLTNAITANLAEVALQSGDADTAWMLSEGVLASARESDDPERVADLLIVLAGVASHRGNLEQARAFGGEALTHMKRADRPDGIADCLFALARLEIDLGREQTARQMLADALEYYRRLGMESKIREVEEQLAGLPKPPVPES